MRDFLKDFTPDELELIKAQNGKFTVSDNILHFDNDLPDAIIEKMTASSFEYNADAWRNGETRHDAMFEPEKIVASFLQHFGLTQQKKEPKKTLVLFDDNSAQFVITHKKYSGALLPMKNKVAYIAKYDKQLQFFFDEKGNYRIDVSDEQTAYEEMVKNKSISAKGTDTDLLMTLAGAVESAYLSNIGYIITVYLPNFAKAMNVQFQTDGKEQKLYDLKSKLKELEDIIGILVEQKKIQFAFKIIELDTENKTLTFASPYLYTIMDLVKKDAHITTAKKINNKPAFDIEGVSYLVDSKINSARNKVTAQVVYYIIARLHQRGVVTDATRNKNKEYNDKKQRTVTITYTDIIKNTPLLKETLKEAPPKRRNQILKRAILGDDYNPKSQKPQEALLESYLRKYTDAFNYWKDLTISFDAISLKDRENKITLKHHGIRGEFQERLSLPYIERPDDLFADDSTPTE